MGPPKDQLVRALCALFHHAKAKIPEGEKSTQHSLEEVLIHEKRQNLALFLNGTNQISELVFEAIHELELPHLQRIHLFGIRN